MAFTDSIRAIPYAPRTQQASGFVPPMLRAMGHILYLTGCLADDDVTVTNEQALEELRHAGAHWDARAETEATSDTVNQRAGTIGTAIGEAIAEYTDWAEDRRVQNLRDLSNRIMAYACDLDRELVGITDSDAGSSL